MYAKFELVKDDADRIRFRLLGRNGEVLLTGRPCEGKIAAQTEVVYARRAIAAGDHLEPRRDRHGHPFVVLKDDGGHVLARSRAVTTENDLPRLVALIRQSNESASVVDHTRPTRNRNAG